MGKFRDEITKMHACRSAIFWVGDDTLEKAWGKCPMAEWMVWYATEVGVGLNLLAAASTDCLGECVDLVSNQFRRIAKSAWRAATRYLDDLTEKRFHAMVESGWRAFSAARDCGYALEFGVAIAGEMPTEVDSLVLWAAAKNAWGLWRDSVICSEMAAHKSPGKTRRRMADVVRTNIPLSTIVSARERHRKERKKR